jgi:hypothetical protein
MMIREAALLEIVTEIEPCSVRQAFYQATVRGIVEKAEAGYDKVERALVKLRRDGRLPWQWIVDYTRQRVQPTTFTSASQALRSLAQGYRRSLWFDAPEYVQIWLEKEALLGVVSPVTRELDVPLMPARGYSSITFLHGAAREIARQRKPTFIYHLGDFDPSGKNAADTIERDLRHMAPSVLIHFERLAVLPEQITAWRLPTRPTKTSDTRAKAWRGGDSVELDAIEPERLRSLVREAIMRHITPEQIAITRAWEGADRTRLRTLAESFGSVPRRRP